MAGEVTWPREQPRREPGRARLVAVSVAGVPVWSEGESLTREEFDRRLARAAAAIDQEDGCRSPSR
jgi:hypothetical protein